MASVREVTAIVDQSEDEVVRLASSMATPGAIAMVHLRMLRAVAREHGAKPDDGFLSQLGDSLSQGLAARTLTERMARWVPVVGRLVDAMAAARLTHELGWAAHEHFASMDPAALKALMAAPEPRVVDPSSIPEAVLADGTPNPMLISQYETATWSGIPELERRLALDPSDDDILTLLAFVYYTSNKLDRAIEIYQRTIQLNGQNTQAHYYLANAYFRRGLFPKAKEEWDRVVELDPEGRLGNNARRRAAALKKLKP